MRQVASTIFLLLFISASSIAQDRYMVFFKDKANSSFSINTPEAFLSERSLARRTKNNVLLSEEDIPVNQAYINQVSSLGVETYFSTKWMNGVLVQMEASQVAEVESLSMVDRVEYVAPGNILTPVPFARAKFAESPVVPSRISERQYEMLDLDHMHQAGFFGEGVLIGVLDDGFQNYNTLSAFEHAVLSNRITYTYDFTRNRPSVDNNFNHGLRVLSIIAADDQEIIGGAPGAQFFLAVTEAPGEYRVEEYNWLFAAEKADSAGVDIITTSLGYNDFFDDDRMDYTVEEMDGLTAISTQAANYAAARGIVIIASAGNTGSDDWRITTAPADSENVISVGAVDENELLAAFSGLGPTADGRIKPDVVALGVRTRLLTSSGGIAFQNGTSFSAPLVASLAAGLMEAFPEITASEIREVIRSSGDRADSPDNFYGYGIPGFIRASRILDETLIPIDQGIVTYPNPTALPYFTIAFEEGFIDQPITAELVNAAGAVIQAYSFTPGLFQNKFRVDLSKVKSGLLVLKVFTPTGMLTKKIIKTQ